jgi:predicted  nucleic acid-binding Zn-ribbon protein
VDPGTPTGQLGLALGNAEALLPPFRSAKEFPVSPKAERLSELYPACRQALVDANAARGLLKQRMAQKKDVITEIRAEIERLEQDLALEASTRLQLHAVNEQLVAALGEMEKMADEVTNTITAAHEGKRTGLKALVDRLKLLVQSWKAFKLNQRAVIAKALSDGHDDGSSR